MSFSGFLKNPNLSIVASIKLIGVFFLARVFQEFLTHFSIPGLPSHFVAALVVSAVIYPILSYIFTDIARTVLVIPQIIIESHLFRESMSDFKERYSYTLDADKALLAAEKKGLTSVVDRVKAHRIICSQQREALNVSSFAVFVVGYSIWFEPQNVAYFQYAFYTLFAHQIIRAHFTMKLDDQLFFTNDLREELLH